MNDRRADRRSVKIPALAGALVGVALALVVLLLFGIGKLDSVAARANERARVNVEVVCGAINEGRRYTRHHVKDYKLGPLPCKELVQRTIEASK